jgi:lipopolysaccharide transport system permease protein
MGTIGDNFVMSVIIKALAPQNWGLGAGRQDLLKSSIMYHHLRPKHKLDRRQLTYYWDLLSELVGRELKILYKRSLLGVAWTLISPLLQLLVFSIVFQQILKTGAGIPHYLSYAFSGLLIWNWTQSSLYQATGLITGNRPMIRQPNFPVPMLPIVTVTTGLIHFLLSMPALMVIMAIDHVTIGWTLILLPIMAILQFALTLSFAYPLAALNVTFRDTQHTLGVILQLMFYLLPVFYSLDDRLIPDFIRPVYDFNPFVILIEAYRSVLLNAGMPNGWGLLMLAGIIGIVLPLGYRIFQRQSTRFVEEI